MVSYIMGSPGQFVDVVVYVMRPALFSLSVFGRRVGGSGGGGHFLLEKQDFLLQFISFPQGEAVELGHGHPEHLLELLRGQMPLEDRQGQSVLIGRALSERIVSESRDFARCVATLKKVPYLC